MQDFLKMQDVQFGLKMKKKQMKYFQTYY